MKYLIISDIHGSFKYLELAIKAFNDFTCEKIICLGDVLYHGPRNDLPEEYSPKRCIELLNNYKDIITCVKGNCDAEVDQMVLNFEIKEPHFVKLNGYLVYLTHGHHLDLVPEAADIVFHGHDHISAIEYIDNVLMVDPGSISIPKGDKVNSFGIMDNDTITIYDFNYKIKHQINLKETSTR